jgi:hypothetical protein
MPEITQADEVRARHLVPAATTMAMVPVVESRRKELAQAFAAHREAERERIVNDIRGVASMTCMLNPVESKVLTQMANAIDRASGAAT